MFRFAVAILMIFIQCFGSVGMARVVCFRGDGSICCISSAWTGSDCCERVIVQEPQGCKCCSHAHNTVNEPNAPPCPTSESLEHGYRDSDTVREDCDCQPVLVMASIESLKSPGKNILSQSLIFTYTEYVFGHGLLESNDWNTMPSNPSLEHCRSSVMRC